jgi:hypothetical protein
MRPPLTDYQRRIAHHRLTFDHPLSPDLEESLRRASLACAENGKEVTGIIDLFCGLYLEYQKEVADHFRGDFTAVLAQNFPKHRFGFQGLIPEVVLDKVTTDDDSCGIGYSMEYSDDLLRLLWLATTLANAAGKKASLKDVFAAATQDTGWMNELLRHGLAPARKIANFKTDIETVIFYATIHMSESWPRQFEFEYDGTLLPPFTLEVRTPSGGFQPVRMAKVKLNGAKVAEIAWPGETTASVPVELVKSNKFELELDGPTFGSIEMTVQGFSENI